MTGRDLVVLGTASQVPTRHRNHNGLLLRWDGEGILFDPGEGTQRQFTLAGVPPRRVHRICVSHLHGDHCLGLPGMLQRLALDGAGQVVSVHFPASGLPYVERLCDASIGRYQPVRLDPIPLPAPASAAAPDVPAVPVASQAPHLVAEGPPLRITALALDHTVDCLGWRVEEPARRHLLPDRLAAAGVAGAAVGELLASGRVQAGGTTVTLEEVSEVRPGLAVAVVMDTRACDAAVELARGVDLLVCEATFLEGESFLAADYGHMTAREAATVAREAGAGRLVLTHLSARYPSPDGHLAEARAVFDDVVVAEDLAVIPLMAAGQA